MLSSLVIWITLVGWAHAENYNPGSQEVAFSIDNPTDTVDFYWEDITKYDSPEEKANVSAAVDSQDPKYQGSVGRLLFPRAQADDQRTIRWAKSLADDAKVHKVSAQPLQLGSVLKRLQCRVSTKPPAEMTVDINLSQPLDREDFGGIEHPPNVKFICEEVDQADKTPYDRRASNTKSTSISSSARATSTISTNSTSTTGPSSFVSPLTVSFFANQESLFQPKNPEPEKPEPEVSTWWIEVTKPEVNNDEPDKPITTDQPEDKDGSKGLGKMIFTHLHPAGRQYLWQKKPADPNDETVRISVSTSDRRIGHSTNGKVCDFNITADPLVDEIYFWVDNFTVQGYKDGVLLPNHPVSDANITNICNTISGEEAENKKGDGN
jgi:hypothetical protein